MTKDQIENSARELMNLLVYNAGREYTPKTCSKVLNQLIMDTQYSWERGPAIMTKGNMWKICNKKIGPNVYAVWIELCEGSK